MNEPEWLHANIVLDNHAEQPAFFGGPAGVRDMGLLESALSGPQNEFAYGETDSASLAAACAFGIARNHPFVDGNKRTAFASLIVFLELNGLKLTASQENATAVMLELAAGNVDEDVLGQWVRTNNGPL